MSVSLVFGSRMVSDQIPAVPMDSLSGEARLLFEQSPVATIVCDAATQLVLCCNPAGCRLYGYAPDQIPSLPLKQLLGANAQPASSVHMCKDGAEIQVETYIHPITWEGKAAQLLFVVDKTEEISTENRLREEAEKSAEAVKARTDFLATMSHEIRTPLNGIVAMAAMLADTKLSHEQRDFLNTIRSSSEILCAVINDVLEYTRIEEQKLTLETLDFDLRACINEVLEITGSSAEQKKLQLLSDVDPDLPSHIKGDPARLKQVLLNLISNSIKFTEHGSVRLSVAKMDGPTQRLRVEVTDTGIGISEEGLANLFQSFAQGDSSIARRFGGTGLGLAICKRLVEMMGGEIGASSELGKGSVFWFTVAFSVSEVQPAESTESMAGVEVLLVQRSQEERATTRGLLEELGMRVTEASNAPQALSLSTQQNKTKRPFPICLVDENLPVIDGIKFAGLLRGQQAQSPQIPIPDIKIILLAASRSPEQLAAAKDLGLDDVLSKPLRRRQLLRSICQFLPSPAAAQTNKDQERESQNSTEGKSASILVVEDNLVNQMVASLCLEKLGYAVQIAEDGLAALDAVGKNQFDLILMDCHMPRMDGVTATKKIREMGGPSQDVPILALTADVFQTERDRCIACGMNDFLSKPIRMDVLKSKLEYWLKQAQ